MSTKVARSNFMYVAEISQLSVHYVIVEPCSSLSTENRRLGNVWWSSDGTFFPSFSLFLIEKRLWDQPLQLSRSFLGFLVELCRKWFGLSTCDSQESYLERTKSIGRHGEWTNFKGSSHIALIRIKLAPSYLTEFSRDFAEQRGRLQLTTPIVDAALVSSFSQTLGSSQYSDLLATPS